jgi:hypothetical protein
MLMLSLHLFYLSQGSFQEISQDILYIVLLRHMRFICPVYCIFLTKIIIMLVIINKSNSAKRISKSSLR